MIDAPATCRPSRLPALCRQVQRVPDWHSPRLAQKWLDREGETQPHPVVHALQDHAASLQGVLWPIDTLFGQERFVKASGLDPRNADFGKQSQETHLISIAGKAGRERVQNP